MHDYSKVMIATPVRDGRFHGGYVVGLMNAQGLHNGWIPKIGQSDIYMARNELLNAFYKQTQYETLIGIDSDIGFSRNDLQMLIESPRDFVSGIYTDKYQPPMPFCRDAEGYNMKHADIPQVGMIKSKMIPGGFFKLERRALQTMIDSGHVETYGLDEAPTYAFYVTRFLRLKEGPRYMTSEDYSLSVLAGLAGIQPWTNCAIRVNHDGRTWDGKALDELA